MTGAKPPKGYELSPHINQGTFYSEEYVMTTVGDLLGLIADQGLQEDTPIWAIEHDSSEPGSEVRPVELILVGSEGLVIF